MAKTKTKTKTKSIVESDFTAEITDNIVMDIYLSKKRKYRDSVKLTFNNCFVVYGSVVETEDSYFISLPSYKKNNGEWKNLCFFFNSHILENISGILIDFYNGLEGEC